MALNHHRCGLGEQEFNFIDTGSSTIISNASFKTKPPSCTDSASASQVSSTASTSLECTSCLDKPTTVECCWPLINDGEQQDFPRCTDPLCGGPFCGECSDHDECCDDCLMDCESVCGKSFDCDELDVGLNDAYCLEGSYCELFGDQTAQTFGFGRPLPQLATDITVAESSGVHNKRDDTVSTPPRNGEDQIILGSDLQPHTLSQFSWGHHPQRVAQQSLEPFRPRAAFTCQGPTRYGLTPPNNSPFTRNATPPFHFSKSPHSSSDPTDSTVNAHYDHINLSTEKNQSQRSLPPLRCQWANSNGEPCGKTVGLGEGMHEHLKSAHDVKTQVYCRWVGCSASVLGSSPHKFASSVERHTWGHSGYRPYRCPACSEGFAAASVRDEHYTNIHLRKKVFACDMCPHLCTSATNLKRHKYDKHSSERFQCEFCNQNGKRRLFPRGPNLARHFRNCKYVLAQFPEAITAGKVKADWLPPGYKRGHHGMERAKITPPNYLLVKPET